MILQRLKWTAWLRKRCFWFKSKHCHCVLSFITLLIYHRDFPTMHRYHRISCHMLGGQNLARSCSSGEVRNISLVICLFDALICTQTKQWLFPSGIYYTVVAILEYISLPCNLKTILSCQSQEWLKQYEANLTSPSQLSYIVVNVFTSNSSWVLLSLLLVFLNDSLVRLFSVYVMWKPKL